MKHLTSRSRIALSFCEIATFFIAFVSACNGNWVVAAINAIGFFALVYLDVADED